MLFNSYTFAAFFALVLVVHFSPLGWKGKKLFLLVMSYVFYSAWYAPYVLLVMFSTVLDWFLAQRIHAAEDIARKRLFLIASLGANLGLLGFFKYGEFLIENFTALAALFGFEYQPAPWSILLPIGISFFTFQTLSYTLDIYNGRMKPWNSFLDYALFVSFFPQLVAGPIVRARQFLPQTRTQASVTTDSFFWGLSLIVLGLFQKVVVADGFCSPIADQAFNPVGPVPFVTMVVGATAFALQVFSDFAGYSTVAIGVARCLGFTLPENFRAPFSATNMSDLWRRWHVSMSSWFRDYVYASIRGKRRTTIARYLSLSSTMMVVGLWHGASWTFVFWGTFMGMTMVIEDVLRRTIGGWSLWDWPPFKWIFQIGTFGIFATSGVFFRGRDLDHSLNLIKSFLGLGDTMNVHVNNGDILIVLVLMISIIGAHTLLRNRSLIEWAERAPIWARAIPLALMIVAIAMTKGDQTAYVYFQF